MLKISTICSVLNSQKKINILLNSFKNQDYKNKELIIVDGGSSDNTINLINKKKNKQIKVLVKKKSTIYEAINHGIKKSSGQVINIMGDNDFFANRKIFNLINKKFTKDISYIYGDTEYVNLNKRLIRYYSSKNFTKKKVKFGFMPSHTSLFIKKKIFNKLGYYSTQYFYASDFDFFYRLLDKKNLKKIYLPSTLTKMTTGGVSNSSIKNILLSNYEVYKILKINKVTFPIFRIFYKLSTKIIKLNIFFIKRFFYEKK